MMNLKNLNVSIKGLIWLFSPQYTVLMGTDSIFNPCLEAFINISDSVSYLEVSHLILSKASFFIRRNPHWVSGIFCFAITEISQDINLLVKNRTGGIFLHLGSLLPINIADFE